jgi:DNA polymerase-1
MPLPAGSSRVFIPAQFNDWDRKTQVEHYLNCGLLLQPVYGPIDPKATDPGKQPKLTLEERLNQTREEVIQRYANGATENLGQIPNRPHVVIDLDDKSEGGRSLDFFFVSYPEFAQIPHVITPGGAHLHVICPDVPEGVTKLETLNLLPLLKAEFFADPSGNVVLPPSVHPCGKPYRWKGNGHLPVIPWAKLVEVFRLQVAAPSAGPDYEKRRKFKGDLRTLNAVALFTQLKVYGKLLDEDKGMHSIRCPWADKHKDGGKHWRPGDSESVVWLTPGRVPTFDCKHTTHCSDKAFEDVLEWAESQEKGIVDRFCRETYQPHAEEKKTDDGLGHAKSFLERADERCPHPPVDWKSVTKRLKQGKLSYYHALHYPKDSILDDFVNAGREILEGADCYILGSVLPIVGAMLGRRVWMPWGAERRHANLYSILVGRAGDRKSSTISLGESIAWRCLPENAFIPVNVSPESLFEQYYEGTGGRPDKLWVVDDANVVVSDWISSAVGERTASRFLRLYDCKPLDEAFMRNKKANEGKALRVVPETSTNIVFGATYGVACFQNTKVRSGMARRFLYYLADGHGRLIVRPRRFDIAPLVEAFKPLLTLSGEVDFSDEAAKLWVDYQVLNRKQVAEADPYNDALQERLNGCPTHVTKVATIFEACRTVHHRQPRFPRIGTSSLECAIQHVDENMRASDTLDRFSGRAATAEQAEIVLAVIRKDFEVWGDTVYADRTDLTKKFCNNTVRRGSLSTDELYKKIFPHLESRGEAVRVVKKGKYELYAFLAEPDQTDPDDDPSDGGNGYLGSSPNSPISPPPPAQPGPENPEEEGIVALKSNLSGENGENSYPAQACGKTVCPGGTGEIGENEENTPVSPHQGRLGLVDDPGALDAAWPALTESDSPLALDLETYSDRPSGALNPRKGDVRLLSVACAGEVPQLFDLKALGYGTADWGALVKAREVIGHNLRFDAAWLLEKLSVRLPKPFCTWSASKVLSNGDVTSRNDLGTALERFLGVRADKAQQTSDWGGMMLTDDQLRYAADDVRHLHALRDKLEAELQSASLWKTFRLEMALLPAVIDMQAAGMPVDVGKLERVIETATDRRKGHEAKLKKHLGPWINFDSPDQIKDAFESIGVTLENTNEETLKAQEHPAAAVLLDYRAEEMVRRQAEALREALSASGRIHAEFKPLGTETGRFSSSNPNLQNVGRGPLRGCFCPADPEHVLIVADYSQLELRASAWFSKDAAMLEAFKQGKDLHALTAAAVLGKQVESVTKADRQLAKAVNFGLLYGQSADGLCRYARTGYGIELSPEAATSLRRKFFAHYRGLAAWHKAAWEKASQTHEGRTIIGRRRLLDKAASDWDRFQAQINYVVQGSCADGMKYALVLLAAQLPAEARLIATVHDEVVVESPRALADQALSVTQSAMKKAFAALFKGLPVEVEAKACASWAEK